jgi:Flp pilus assembly protein TadG
MMCDFVHKKRGAAMMELALLSPWIIFIFIGVLDWGFYAVSLMTLENATRAATIYAASGSTTYTDTTNLCQILYNEMGSLSNMQGVTTCGGTSPVSFTASQGAGPDNNTAVTVAVTYTTPQMIPIPGLLAGKFTITRTMQMRCSS